MSDCVTKHAAILVEEFHNKYQHREDEEHDPAPEDRYMHDPSGDTALQNTPLDQDVHHKSREHTLLMFLVEDLGEKQSHETDDAAALTVFSISCGSVAPFLHLNQ
ncbi:MAG: hypothetical protein C5S49_01980 [Candidatus Methanogaster sp.]|nr:MAG: hypothetical protein C5S49_01980 [ANME-2 cluster archaeon]